MLALNILEVKDCMEKLLLSDTFDSFSFIEGDITTFMTIHIDGYLKKEFFTTEEQEEFLATHKLYPSWGEVRSHCFQLIKGKKVPLDFKFVLAFSRENLALLLAKSYPSMTVDDISGLFLRFHYYDDKLECITGTSLKTFTLDKSMEHIWDDTAMKYLKQKEILFTTIS